MGVKHIQIYKPSAFGGITNTTLCGRRSNATDDMNISDTAGEATCKLCIRARDAEYHPLQKWIGWQPENGDYA